MNLQNAIRVNHRGFLKDSQKRFILTEKSTNCDTFKVFLIDNVNFVSFGNLEIFISKCKNLGFFNCIFPSITW